jgi:hypothetical protein
LNQCLSELCPLNPDSDPVFLLNPSPDPYLGGCFIAIFGTQLEDNFFEHSLEDLKEDYDNFLNQCLFEPCPLNPDSDLVFFVNPAPETYLGEVFIAIFSSQLEDDFCEHSLEDLKVGAGGI